MLVVECKSSTIHKLNLKFDFLNSLNKRSHEASQDEPN